MGVIEKHEWFEQCNFICEIIKVCLFTEFLSEIK